MGAPPPAGARRPLHAPSLTRTSAARRHTHLCCATSFSPRPARAAVTGLLAHNVTPDTKIGAEVVRDLGAGTTTFAAGATARSPPWGPANGMGVLCRLGKDGAGAAALAIWAGCSPVPLRLAGRNAQHRPSSVQAGRQAGGSDWAHAPRCARCGSLAAAQPLAPCGPPPASQAWPRRRPTAHSPRSSWTTPASCPFCTSRHARPAQRPGPRSRALLLLRPSTSPIFTEAALQGAAPQSEGS